jgi:hypothetical protein
MASIQSAPELAYSTAQGEQKKLSDAWRDRPALILWMRHFG